MKINISNLLQEFFEKMGYDKDSNISNITRSPQNSSPAPYTSVVTLKDILNSEYDLELSFQEDVFDENKSNSTYCGKTVFGRESSQTNPNRYNTIYFQRVFDKVRFPDNTVVSVSDVSVRYSDEEAINHFQDVLQRADNDSYKMLELSDIKLNILPPANRNITPISNLDWMISYRTTATALDFSPSDLMQKKFIEKWVMEKGMAADIVVISVGSNGTDAQQKPPFADEARADGKKVEILNIDKSFPASFYGEGISFLEGNFSQQNFPESYAYLKQFLTEKTANPEYLAILTIYTSPFGHNRFEDIVQSNKNKQNLVTIQGYCHHSCAAILSNKFFDTNLSKSDIEWHRIFDDNHQGKPLPKIPDSISTTPLCVKIFANLSAIGMRDLQEFLQLFDTSQDPSTSITSPKSEVVTAALKSPLTSSTSK